MDDGIKLFRRFSYTVGSFLTYTLTVPELGELYLQTEFGLLHVRPGEIVVVQRGIRFSVQVNGSVRGYISEVSIHSSASMQCEVAHHVPGLSAGVRRALSAAGAWRNRRQWISQSA